MVRNRVIILFQRLVSWEKKRRNKKALPTSENLTFPINDNCISNPRPRDKSFRRWIPRVQWRSDSKDSHFQ